MKSLDPAVRRKSRSSPSGIMLRSAFLAAIAAVSLLSSVTHAQKGETEPQPVVVQPGAPGQPSQRLPSTTRAQLPPLSPKDVEFMQGMIMHHAQAVEMTALINDRTTNEKLRLLGSRISHSQADEMRYMERWLKLRGMPVSNAMSPMHHSSGMAMPKRNDGETMMMPGMLTKEQMEALKAARGAEFDRLFLLGMIQHHKGALAMVEEMFNTAGSGQDSELFNFATDVDSGQRAEIKIMESMLGERP